MGEANHCPDCRNEFVAGITMCSDCGQPLRPGELPRGARPAALVVEEESDAPLHGEAPDLPDPPDTLVATLPGEDAERIARALTLEHISSLLDCEGTQELRGPSEPPKPAIARRKPVSIYVAHTRVDEAREIIESLVGVDLIGEQWRSGDAGDDGHEEGAAASSAPRAAVPAAQGPHDLEAPAAEGSGRYLVLLAILGAILAVFIALL
jgi:hypothetical protein